MDNNVFTIILPVINLERAVSFYETILGLCLVPSDNPQIVLFSCGTMQLGLYRSSQKPLALAGWLVEDIDGKVKELRQRGITFIQVDCPGMKTDGRGIAESENALLACLKDTEGNILTLTQLK